MSVAVQQSRKEKEQAWIPSTNQLAANDTQRTVVALIRVYLHVGMCIGVCSQQAQAPTDNSTRVNNKQNQENRSMVPVACHDIQCKHATVDYIHSPDREEQGLDCSVIPTQHAVSRSRRQQTTRLVLSRTTKKTVRSRRTGLDHYSCNNPGFILTGPLRIKPAGGHECFGSTCMAPACTPTVHA